MTEEKLKSFIKKQNDLKELQALIRSEYNAVHAVTATVSRRSTRDLSGPTVKTLERIDQLQKVLEKAEDEYLTDYEEIEAWLRSIPDLNIVAIIRWHFLLGYNWRETSVKVFKKNDYCYARVKYLRYAEANHIFEEEPE